ncbi:MAG TPA: class I SAM-dependent methyltransferase [Methylococcaceae bacterium]|nr:class I SAM-dependent methyltransferase [Methylococcaceae bacterium]
MQRQLEPELMDDAEQADAYAAADFSEANGLFVALFSEFCGKDFAGTVLDLGCGPGDICLRLARTFPGSLVHGLDGAAAMLGHAKIALAREPVLARRVRFILGRLPDAALPMPAYDAVVSNSLLHHLPDPQVLWGAVRRSSRPGTRVLAMDLFRPSDLATAERLVKRYAADAPPVLQRDFLNSLCAAFQPEEIVAQLRVAGLGHFTVQVVSDRHVAVSGVVPDGEQSGAITAR